MSNEEELMKKDESVSVLESKHVPTDYCQDDGDEDIEPLSGKPFFHTIITKSHLGSNYKYQLIVPSQIAQTLPNTTVPVTLTRGGKSWETAYLGEYPAYYKKFDNRWKAFAEDNMLKIDDVCVFELMKRTDTALDFKVQVLRGDIPSVLLSKQYGSSDNPIVVD